MERGDSDDERVREMRERGWESGGWVVDACRFRKSAGGW